MIAELKQCNKCLLSKDKAEFHKDKYKKDGLKTHCKACNNKASKVWDEENIDRAHDRHVSWREDNRESIRPKNRLHTQNWRTNNPIRAKEMATRDYLNRRARLANAFIEEVDKKIVWLRDDGICWLCSEQADCMNWHLDHKIPIIKDGQHSYENTAVTHPFCNLSKGSRIKQ